MTRRRIALGLCMALALAAVFGASLYRDRTRRPMYTETWWDLFDTVTVVSGYADSAGEWQAQAEALHADLLRYHPLFDIYNHYDGLTTLADLNEQAADGPVAVDPALMELLVFGKQAYALTNGACNIAAGGVLALWHDARESVQAAQTASGETARDSELTALLPDETALTQAARHMDIRDLVLDEQAGTVRFADPELQLDVGAIAKGWAVEQAARAAEARGLDSALINAGGSVRAIGTKADGSRWTAGVQDPDGGDVLRTVALEDGQSLIVSGDYQRYFELDGVRYHHLIDLATLQPARYCRSVAILCRDAGLGDALSTGLFCLPPDQGQTILKELTGAEALWIFEDGTLRASDGWPAEAD